MAEVWLLTLQIAMLAFVLCTATAGIIWAIQKILKKFSSKDRGDKT